MIPPTRWRDDPSAPQGVREALRVGRASRPLPSDSRRRSASRVHRLVFVPAAAGLIFWIKSAAIASLCVVGTVAVVRLAVEPTHVEVAPEPRSPVTRAPRGPMAGRPPSSAQAPATPPAAEIPESPPSVAPTAIAETLARSNAPPAPTPLAGIESARKEFIRKGKAQGPGSEPVAASGEAWVDPAPEDSLAREAAMLEEARAMLNGNPAGTLGALDRYAARFPSGQLTMEGELLAVDALRRLGRRSEAKARAASLLANARGSLYEPRIRTMLAE
jgi:hypothetical protein